MKRLDKDTAVACFSIHVANRTQIHAATGIELVNKPNLAIIVAELPLTHSKQLVRDPFQLEGGLIADATMALKLIAPSAFNLVGHDSTLSW